MRNSSPRPDAWISAFHAMSASSISGLNISLPFWTSFWLMAARAKRAIHGSSHGRLGGWTVSGPSRSISICGTFFRVAGRASGIRLSTDRKPALPKEVALPGSALSRRMTLWPLRCRARAVAAPTIPAPMTMTGSFVTDSLECSLMGPTLARRLRQPEAAIDLWL